MSLLTDGTSIANAVAGEIAADATKRPKELASLKEKVDEAGESILASLGALNKAREDFEPISKQYIQSIRAFASCAVLELASARKELADIRKFFLSKEHDDEVAKLREFVELCERLQKLKKDGTLDAIADTIIKLA